MFRSTCNFAVICVWMTSVWFSVLNFFCICICACFVFGKLVFDRVWCLFSCLIFNRIVFGALFPTGSCSIDIRARHYTFHCIINFPLFFQFLCSICICIIVRITIRIKNNFSRFNTISTENSVILTPLILRVRLGTSTHIWSVIIITSNTIATTNAFILAWLNNL